MVASRRFNGQRFRLYNRIGHYDSMGRKRSPNATRYAAEKQADANMDKRLTGLERTAYEAYLKRAKAEYAEFEKVKQEYELQKLLEQQQSEYERAAYGDGGR